MTLNKKPPEKPGRFTLATRQQQEGAEGAQQFHG